MRSHSPTGRLVLLLAALAGSSASPAQDTIHFSDGRVESGLVSEVTSDFLVYKFQPPNPAIRRVDLASVATVRFGRRPEMDRAGSSEGLARLDALRRVWYLLRPSLELPESPAGQWGIEFAGAVLGSDLPDNVKLSFDVFETIEQRDWNRDRRLAARRGRFNAMLNLGMMREAMEEAHKAAADPLQEDPELLILARMMLGDFAFKELKTLEQEHPKWPLDDKIRPRRNRLFDEAMDHYLFAHLGHGAHEEAAARGLWAAIQLMLHGGDTPAAALRARDLARLYPNSSEATAARELAKQAPPEPPPEPPGAEPLSQGASAQNLSEEESFTPASADPPREDSHPSTPRQKSGINHPSTTTP